VATPVGRTVIAEEKHEIFSSTDVVRGTPGNVGMEGGSDQQSKTTSLSTSLGRGKKLWAEWPSENTLESLNSHTKGR